MALLCCLVLLQQKTLPSTPFPYDLFRVLSFPVGSANLLTSECMKGNATTSSELHRGAVSGTCNIGNTGSTEPCSTALIAQNYLESHNHTILSIDVYIGVYQSVEVACTRLLALLSVAPFACLASCPAPVPSAGHDLYPYLCLDPCPCRDYYPIA